MKFKHKKGHFLTKLTLKYLKVRDNQGKSKSQKGENEKISFAFRQIQQLWFFFRWVHEAFVGGFLQQCARVFGYAVTGGVWSYILAASVVSGF